MNKNSQLYIDSKNRYYCVCIKDYLFNPNEYFDGIHFHKGDTYIVDMDSFLKNENSDLVAVIHHSDVFVGMSIQRFREHFKDIEGEKSGYDII